MGHVRALPVPVVENDGGWRCVERDARCGTRSLSRRRLMPCAMRQERRPVSVGDLCETEGTHTTPNFPLHPCRVKSTLPDVHYLNGEKANAIPILQTNDVGFSITSGSYCGCHSFLGGAGASATRTDTAGAISASNSDHRRRLLQQMGAGRFTGSPRTGWSHTPRQNAPA
jgi:hypothetical protein